MKQLIVAFLLATTGLSHAGRWEMHHGERVWVHNDGTWHYKNDDQIVGPWKNYHPDCAKRYHPDQGK